jgi:hypothetical protein
MKLNLLKPRWKLAAAVVVLAAALFGALQSIKFFSPHSLVKETATSVDIAITEEGIYQVTVGTFGWDEADLANMQLFQRDQPVPIWISGTGRETKIHFFGEASDSAYTSQQIYQLKMGTEPGLRIREVTETPATAAAPGEEITSTVRIEENLIYSPLVEEGDHWLWVKLAAPITQTASMDLAAPLSGGGRVKAALWGNTEAPTTPNHHVVIRINGKQVAEGSWDGQTRKVVEGQVPKGTLQEGVNVIEIECPGDTGTVVDIVSLDWIEVSYSRRSQLTEEQSIFTADDAAIQLFGGGEEMILFDITQAGRVSAQTIQGDSATFLSEKGHRYAVVRAGGWLQPDMVEASVVEPDLKRQDDGAEYLAIGPTELLKPISPLLELRAEQGLSVKQVPVEAIYDQFNGGMEEPQAIQAFLAYAVRQWKTVPKYVLLVGDSSYDFRNYTDGKNGNRLPVMMVQTIFGGETGSDVLIADINEDPWPDLAIGRLPAQTPEQIETYVQKVLRYEGEDFTPGERLKILAIADGQEKIFQSDAANFLDSFEEAFEPTLLAAEPGDGEANQKVIQEMNSGYWLVGYFGHGSINMWGKDRLFTIEDVARLSDTGQQPILLHFTCLTGLFTHPDQESLTERLLWYSSGGAIAALAPTSLTLSMDQQTLSSAFIEALSQTNSSRLGDVVLAAWRAMPAESANTLDVMRTFLLFGDPALKLP